MLTTPLYPILGVKTSIYNPLWLLLETNELPNTDAVRISSYLPFDIQKQLLSNDRRIIKGDTRAIYKLSRLNTLDALAAILIIFLHIKTSISDHLTYFVNQEITLLIFRLFLIRFHNYDAGYYLIRKLSLLFRKIELPPDQTHAFFTIWKNEKPHSFQLPMTLSGITSSEILQGCCEVSEYITNTAIVLLEKENTASIKNQIYNSLNYNSLNYNNLDELTWNFYQIETGSHPRKISLLWRLRDQLPTPN